MRPEVRLPDSHLARLALELLEDVAPPSLVNHSIRSYVWAVALADIEGVAWLSRNIADGLYLAAPASRWWPLAPRVKSWPLRGTLLAVEGMDC